MNASRSSYVNFYDIFSGPQLANKSAGMPVLWVDRNVWL